jgi:deoxyadenosine/deoxycytidine kinase
MILDVSQIKLIIIKMSAVVNGLGLNINVEIISVDGNIGSGKSTLISYLKKEFKENPHMIFLDEPVDEWNTICDKQGCTILSKFYEDQEKYAFSFQMMAYISRLALIQTTIQNLNNKHALLLLQEKSGSDSKVLQNRYYIFTERSLHTDREVFAKMLYDQGKIELMNYKIYLKWFDNFAYKPNTYFYIITNPEICLERIDKRKREAESGISLEYLTICHDYHKNMFSNLKYTNIDFKSGDLLLLNGNEENNHNTLIRQIRKYLQI